MSILLINSVNEVGGGGQNYPKFCLRGLYTAPMEKTFYRESMDRCLQKFIQCTRILAPTDSSILFTAV